MFSQVHKRSIKALMWLGVLVILFFNGCVGTSFAVHGSEQAIKMHNLCRKDKELYRLFKEECDELIKDMGTDKEYAYDEPNCEMCIKKEYGRGGR